MHRGEDGMTAAHNALPPRHVSQHHPSQHWSNGVDQSSLNRAIGGSDDQQHNNSTSRGETAMNTHSSNGSYPPAPAPVHHHHHYYPGPSAAQVASSGGYPPIYHHSLEDYHRSPGHHPIPGSTEGPSHSNGYGQQTSSHPYFGSHHSPIPQPAAPSPAPPANEWSQLPPIRLLPPLQRPSSFPYLPGGYHPHQTPYPASPNHWNRPTYNGYSYEDTYHRYTPHYYERRPASPLNHHAGLSTRHPTQNDIDREPSPRARPQTVDMDTGDFDERVKFENSVQALQSLASAATGSRSAMTGTGPASTASSSYQHHFSNGHHRDAGYEQLGTQGTGSDPQHTTNSSTNHASNSTASTSGGSSHATAANGRPNKAANGNGPEPSRSARNGQHASSSSSDEDKFRGASREDVVSPDGKIKKKRKRRRKATEEPRDFASRKFTCATCKKMFARPSALATHERSHSKEKPHVCPVVTCRRPFAVPSNLRRHQRVYKHYDPNAPLPPEASPGSRDAQRTSDLQNGARTEGPVLQTPPARAASHSPVLIRAAETAVPLPPLPNERPGLPQHHSSEAASTWREL